MVRKLGVAAGAAVAGLMVTAPLPAASAGLAVELLSHRAVYAMTLKTTADIRTVAAIDGRMVLEWADVCDGYTTNQRMVTEIADAEGHQTITDFVATSWESRDGLKYRFAMRQNVDGETAEEFVGEAVMEGEGEPGEAQFEKPEVKKAALPAGTIFPSEHMADLIAAAIRGDTAVSRIVFDGAGESVVYEAVAFLGQARQEDGEPDDAEFEGGSLVEGRRWWPVTVAYFPRTTVNEEGVPEFEMSFRMYENGVTGDIVMNYGEFSLSGSLDRLEGLPDPGC